MKVQLDILQILRLIKHAIETDNASRALPLIEDVIQEYEKHSEEEDAETEGQ